MIKAAAQNGFHIRPHDVKAMENRWPQARGADGVDLLFCPRRSACCAYSFGEAGRAATARFTSAAQRAHGRYSIFHVHS